MTPFRVAEILAWELNGTRWERECLARGKDPLAASADDIIGPMPIRMTYDGGKRVLSFEEEWMSDHENEPSPDEIVVEQTPRELVADLREIAGLTKQEAAVTLAIVDGSPIPDGKYYTAPLARRLKTTSKALREAWRRAKTKLLDHWVAD